MAVRRMYLKKSKKTLSLALSRRTHRLKTLRRHKNKIAERKNLHFFILQNE